METNEGKLFLACNCLVECGIVSLSHYWDEEEGDSYYLAYWQHAFDYKQDGILRTIGNRIKLAWNALAGNEFRLYEVLLDGEQIEELHQWIEDTH